LIYFLFSYIVQALQDFIVLPTEIFRRYVISSSSVISLPTDYVRRLSLRRWFPIMSLYRSETQKNHMSMVLQTKFARQKKNFPAWNIPTDFISSVISWFTDGYVPSVNLSVSVWNTDQIYPSVNSSVIVAATVKCRRIQSVGKAVGECLKYRHISFYKCVGECYCQIPTDSFRRQNPL